MVSVSIRGFFFATSVAFLPTLAGGTTIVDLSKDFEVGNLDSSGSKKVVDAVSAVLSTRRLLVLEKGKIVVDYTREGCNTWSDGQEFCDVTPDDIFRTFSAAKGLDAIAVGHLVDAGLVTSNDTLGSIFPDDSTWENITHAEYIKGVSIRELLSATSGLAFTETGEDTCGFEIHDSCVYDLGGKDLFTALNNLSPIPGIPDGWFTYIGSHALLSYIFLQLTGQGIREYVASNIFPDLGIDNNSIRWAKNSDGVDVPGDPMMISAYDMAKYGQLVLQKGMSSPDTSLISAEWIEESLAPVVVNFGMGSDLVHPPEHVDANKDIYFFTESDVRGYHWFTHEYNGLSVYCSSGFFDQFICVQPEMERVFVRKSDMEPYLLRGVGSNMYLSDLVALSNETVFGEQETDVEDQTPSGAASVLRGWFFVAALFAIWSVAP